MTVIDRIVSFLFDVSYFFYDIYEEVYGWVYPFWLAAGFFYQLSSIFASLARNFYDFGVWVDSIASQITTFFTWSNLEQWFKDWKAKILDAWNWIRGAWDNIWDEIDDWWNSTKSTVKGWISVAEDWLKALINSVEKSFATLQAAWNEWKVKIPSFNELWLWFTNWWGNTLKNIIAWGALTALQIQGLIDSALKSYAPFWEGWQDWKDKVTEFFTDPEEWLYKAIDRIFERFW